MSNKRPFDEILTILADAQRNMNEIREIFAAQAEEIERYLAERQEATTDPTQSTDDSEEIRK